MLGTVGRRAPAERRDQLLTMTSVGSAFGLWLAIPFVKTLIDLTTVATSLFILSAIIASIVVLALPFRRKNGAPKTESMAPVSDRGLYLKHSLQNRSFVFLLMGFFVCGFHIAFVGVHLPAFLEDKTGDAALGARALAFIGFANVFGTLAAGYLGEKLTKSKTLCLIYFARFFVFLGFWLLPMTLPNIYILSLAMGFLWLGTVPLTSGLVAAIYGTKWLSMLFGVVFFSHQLGAFLGSWLGGRLFDLTQSYDLMWQGAALLALISALLHLPIKEDLAVVESSA